MGRTVLIVDDHAGFRAAARALLEAGGFNVLGEAADGASALAAVAKLQPEIVLLDVQLPDLDGFAVAERLASDGVPSAIVLISSRDVSSFRRRLAANPGWSFIPKSELTGEALSAVAG
jgi:DNA-binding NarL/FixJ family response regulator